MKKESVYQDKTTIYICPNCTGEQLISKPEARAAKGGSAAITNIVKCDFCSDTKLVRRYPDGTFIILH